jgi:hypothetical protein
VAEIELGRGTTPLPAGIEAEGVSDQRCVVTIDETGYHIQALESLTLPSWRATFTWETVTHLEVEPTPLGVAITIGDHSPGHYRVELRNTSAEQIEKTLAPFCERAE